MVAHFHISRFDEVCGESMVWARYPFEIPPHASFICYALHNIFLRVLMMNSSQDWSIDVNDLHCVEILKGFGANTR